MKHLRKRISAGYLAGFLLFLCTQEAPAFSVDLTCNQSITILSTRIGVLEYATGDSWYQRHTALYIGKFGVTVPVSHHILMAGAVCAVTAAVWYLMMRRKPT
jgi:hypothetical protein